MGLGPRRGSAFSFIDDCIVCLQLLLYLYCSTTVRFRLSSLEQSKNPDYDPTRACRLRSTYLLESRQ